MSAKFSLPLIVSVIFPIAACGPSSDDVTPVATINYSAITSDQLWHHLTSTASPLEILLIEAELASRGQESSGAEYLGRRTAASVGKAVYIRTQSSSNPIKNDRNCADFATAAQAQKFFLDAGGPTSDAHDLDRDGDGNACEWGATLARSAIRHRPNPQPAARAAPRPSYSSRCYVGPRGGTYTITPSGAYDYDGC